MKSPVLLLAAILAVVLVSGCERDLTGLELAPGNTDPLVFDDTFGAGVEYGAFEYSDFNALSIDTEIKRSGTASMKVTVPDGDSYAGGAFFTGSRREFTGYNALTFWARASKTSVINEVGFGINLDWTTPYFVQWFNVQVNTEWKKYIIPIPDPSRLTREGGLFYYSVKPQPEGAAGHELWFDDIRFEKVEPGTITNPKPVMDDKEINGFIGMDVPVSGTHTTYTVNGANQMIFHTAKYLSFISSDSDVAAIIDGREINVIGMGTAEITATLRGVPAEGTIELTVNPSPVTPAPDPTEAQEDVISIFSHAYDDIQVETWAAQWEFPGSDPADVQDFSIAGNIVKLYTDFGFAAITFENNVIDATEMEYMHVDIWVPEYVTYLRIKLVDFGPNGVYEDPPVDDSDGEVLLYATSDPPLVKGEWISLDIPLERFMTGLDERAHLAQLVFEEATGGTLFVDNIYFFKSPAGE